MFRFLAVGAMLACTLFPAASRAAAPTGKSEGPTLMLRIQSVDQLLNNGEYIAGLVGFEEQAKQLLGFVRVLAGPKGIEGVNINKPFVLYAHVAQEIVNSKAVLMVPIADKEAFIGLLKTRLGLAITEDKDGLYSTEAPNNMGTIFFRFANGYVYGTYLNKENVAAAALAPPEEVVGKDDSVLSLSFRIDRVPQEMKKFALGEIENNLAKAKEMPLQEIDTPALRSLKNQTIDCISASVKDVLNDGEAVTLNINVDKKKDELGLELQMTAKKGSELAREIAGLKSKKSVVFGDAHGRNTAALLVINASLPPTVKKLLGPAVDDLVKFGMENAPIDQGAKMLLAPIVQAAIPTLKSGDLDIGTVLLGPTADGKYTSISMAKIVEGKNLEKAIKEAVGKLPPEFQAFVEVDAESIGSTKIHRIKISDKLDEKTRKLVGETDLWLAFRDDAVIAGLGPKVKEALAQAINSSPEAGPVLKLEFSIGRLIPAAEVENEKAAKQAAKEVFGDNPTGDTFALTIDGGDRLYLKAAVKGKVIKYIAVMEKAKENSKK